MHDSATFSYFYGGRQEQLRTMKNEVSILFFFIISLPSLYFHFFFAKQIEPHWRATATVKIYDMYNNSQNIRLLLDNRNETTVMKKSVLTDDWPRIQGFNVHEGCSSMVEGPCVHTKVSNENGTEERNIAFALVENLTHTSVRAPTLSEKNYSDFWSYCYATKTPPAETNMITLHQKWLKIDGMLGREDFEAFEIDYPISESLNEKLKILDTDLGALLITLQ